MDIHITRNGEQHGPYPAESARQMLEAGQLLPADLAWHEGADGWKPLSKVLGAAAPPPALPPVLAGAPALPPVLAGGDPDQIRVIRKGEPIGPYSREKAKVYFASGQLLPTDLGWHDGMGKDWKPLNEVLGLRVLPPEKKVSSWQGLKDGWISDGKLKRRTLLISLVLSIALFVAGIFLSIAHYVMMEQAGLNINEMNINKQEGIPIVIKFMMGLGGAGTWQCIVKLCRNS